MNYGTDYKGMIWLKIKQMLQNKLNNYDRNSFIEFSFIILLYIVAIAMTFTIKVNNFNHVYVASSIYLISLLFVLRYGFFGLQLISPYYIISAIVLIRLYQLSNDNQLLLYALLMQLVMLLIFVILGVYNEKKLVLEQKLERLSYYDAVTDIPNYRYFLKRYDEEFSRAERHHYNLGLIIFDIDNFKFFNDELGHRFGDDVLKAIAQNVSTILRTDDVICRYGGDEFLIIMPFINPHDLKKVSHRIETIVKKVNQELNIPSEYQLTLSIGYSEYPNLSSTQEELFTHADKALNNAKDAGKNNLKTYEEFAK
jgi:diguanylate cyclase (GGDEF)-like protein